MSSAANPVASAPAGMDKIVMKNIFAQAGLAQVKYVSFIKSEWSSAPTQAYEQVEKELGFLSITNMVVGYLISKQNKIILNDMK